MLANTITLAVDVAGNGTLVNQVYTRDDEFPNRALYVGVDNTASLRNTITTYRTKPKKSGNFPGVTKAEVKFTQDAVVPGVDLSTSFAGANIVDASTSFTVGITPALAMELRQRLIAWFDNEVAIATTENGAY